MTAKSYEIIQQFVRCKAYKKKDMIIAQETEILFHVTNDIENQYRSILEEVVAKCWTFNDIAIVTKEMEKDMNWGRLLILYTFSGMVAKKHKRDEVMIEKLINWLSCCSNIWIDVNGGWNEFIKRYGQRQERYFAKYFLYCLVPPCIYFIGKSLIKCL